jgi:carboxyl-terminal processing protease
MFRLTVALLSAAAALHAADDLDAQLKTIISAYAIMEQNAADPVSSEQAFFQGAIPGLLRRLDPHSVFFDPAQFDQVKKMEESTQKGFGSVVSLLPGRVIVLQAQPGTPSAKSGLSPGDEILAINGYEISRLDLEQLTQLLTQSRQQAAQLVVRRPGIVRMLTFTLIPEEMQASRSPVSTPTPPPRSRRPLKSWVGTTSRGWSWTSVTIRAGWSRPPWTPRPCFYSRA